MSLGPLSNILVALRETMGVTAFTNAPPMPRPAAAKFHRSCKSGLRRLGRMSTDVEYLLAVAMHADGAKSDRAHFNTIARRLCRELNIKGEFKI